MNKSLTIPKLFVRFSWKHLLMSAIALGVLLRILNLGSREFWYDEVLSLLLSNGQKSAYHTPKDVPVILAEYTSLLSLPVEVPIRGFITTFNNLFHSLLGGEPHPPLFFLSQHIWLRLFGNSEAAMRSLNAMVSVGAIASIYGLGKLLLGTRGGLLLAALLALNPFFLFHSLNFRMYAPLVLWAILSAWSLLHLTYQQDNDTGKSRHVLLWSVILITSVAAGLLTFYLYAYWVITLAALVLYLDRQHWWQHGLRLGTGVLLTMPWVLWGTLKQLRNADLKRFGVTPQSTNPLLTHLQNVAQTLGTHLVVGDWVTTLPLTSVIFSGCVTILLLVLCSISLWHCKERQKLGIALILGILPILLALLVDFATKKFTLGFGYGRTMIIILPGCLLLLTLWLEKALPKQWRIPIATGLLLLYLSISVGDFSQRQRSVFHSVAELILQQPKQPTLVAMNSQAWGHVMRLAYYISPKAPVMLLAQKPVELATNLQKVLKEDIERYPRIIWLDSDNPVWSRLNTEAEIQREKQRVQQVLSDQYQLKKSQHLSGTMSLDNFTVNVYERSSKN